MEEGLSESGEGRCLDSSGNSSGRNLWTLSLRYCHSADSVINQAPSHFFPNFRFLGQRIWPLVLTCSLCFVCMAGSQGAEMAFRLCLSQCQNLLPKKGEFWRAGQLYCLVRFRKTEPKGQNAILPGYRLANFRIHPRISLPSELTVCQKDVYISGDR